VTGLGLVDFWFRNMSWLSSSWIRLPTPTTARHLLYGIIIGFSLSLSTTSIALYYRSRKQDRITAQFDPRPIELRSDEILYGVTGLIGMSHCYFISSSISRLL
jgi:cysteine synthase A